MNIWDVRERIYKQATIEQGKHLNEEDNYHAPYSFWRSALEYGLASQEDYEQAQAYYGRDGWHYVGD